MSIRALLILIAFLLALIAFKPPTYSDYDGYDAGYVEDNGIWI